MTDIELGSNGIGDEGCSSLAMALFFNSKLTVLGLRFNQVRDRLMRCLPCYLATQDVDLALCNGATIRLCVLDRRYARDGIAVVIPA